MIKNDFTEIVDKEFATPNVRWLLEGFCSTDNSKLGVSSGWIDLCEGHQFGAGPKKACNKCEWKPENYHVIEQVGIGIFSSWSVHSASGYTALLVIYNSMMSINIYDGIKSLGPKTLDTNYLKFTGEIFDEFLNSILLESTYEYTGSLISGTTTLSQYGSKSGLIIFGEAGKGKNSNWPLLPYVSQYSGEYLIYDIFQEGEKKVASLIIPTPGAEILGLGKQQGSNSPIGPMEVRNFGVPIDLFTAHLNLGIQNVNQIMLRGKSVDPSFEALIICRTNFWSMLERAISEGLDFKDLVLSTYSQKQQDAWRDVILQLRGRLPEVN